MFEIFYSDIFTNPIDFTPCLRVCEYLQEK